MLYVFIPKMNLNTNPKNPMNLNMRVKLGMNPN